MDKKPTPTQIKLLENAAGRQPPHRPFGNSQHGGWDRAMVSCHRNGWLEKGKITERGEAVLKASAHD